jgi:hypothetical protein
MTKRVRISFPLKTTAQMAQRLGISGSRLGRLLSIARIASGSSGGGSTRVAYKSKSHAVNSRTARRRNAKRAR